MHASDTADRTPHRSSKLARLLVVLAVALTLVAIPAAMPDAASAKRLDEHVAMRRCLSAGGTVTWDFHADGSADLICTLPSKKRFVCAPVDGPFANIVNCFCLDITATP